MFSTVDDDAHRACSTAPAVPLGLSTWLEQLAVRLGPALKKVSLFGSRARGTHRTRSDIDLLVLLEPCQRPQRDVVQDTTLEWELEHNLDLSLRVFSESEFAQLSNGVDPFWRNLARDEKQTMADDLQERVSADTV